MKRALLILALPTVWDLAVQACRLVSCRRQFQPGAVEAIAAVCNASTTT